MFECLRMNKVVVGSNCQKKKNLLNIPKPHISLSFSCSPVIFRYFLLIILDVMNAGVPIIKYIQIYPYYTAQPGNFDGKPTYLPLSHTFYSKRAVIRVIFWSLLHWMQYYMLKREQKFNYSFNPFNFVRGCRCYFEVGSSKSWKGASIWQNLIF